MKNELKIAKWIITILAFLGVIVIYLNTSIHPQPRTAIILILLIISVLNLVDLTSPDRVPTIFEKGIKVIVAILGCISVYKLLVNITFENLVAILYLLLVIIVFAIDVYYRKDFYNNQQKDETFKQ